MRETFTPLSILVRNTGAGAASGRLTLRRMVLIEAAQEPLIQIPFEVPPFEERWIQSGVYVLDENAQWEVSWGPDPKQKAEFPTPRLGDQATILLQNPDDRPRSTGLLRRFRTNLFPASVTMTDGLRAVFVDSIPELQGARLQAFLEWLARGGTVVVLQGEDGVYPRFSGPLAVLNDAREVSAVGGGR